MRGFLLFIGIILVGISATWAYRVNYRTQAAMDRVASLQRHIAQEQENMSVLRAEWAYLNRPERLLALSEEYFPQLQLMPIYAEHFADPMKVAYPSVEDPLLAELIDAAISEIQEGSE